jgi:hypothetical protein
VQVQCGLRLFFVSNFACQCAVIIENYTNTETTNMDTLLQSADGVALRVGFI